MLQIAETTLKRQKILLPDDGQHVYIGHNAVLDTCEVHFRIKRKSNLTLAKSRFVGCEFFADRPLRGAQWTYCHVDNCKFHGRFKDNRFGYWPEYFNSGEVGSIDQCDFSDAELHLCEFFGCDMSRIVLPRWPCFTIIGLKRLFDAVSQMQARPEWLTFWNAIDGEVSRSPTYRAVAMTYHAPTYARWLSESVFVTEVELRDFLRGRENVVM